MIIWLSIGYCEGFTCYRRIKSPPAYTHPGPSPFPNPPHSRTQKSHRGWHTLSPPAGRTWPHRTWRTPPRWCRWWRAAGPQGRSRGTWPRLPPRWRPPNVPRDKDLALGGNGRIHSGGYRIFRRKNISMQNVWMLSREKFLCKTKLGVHNEHTIHGWF